MEKHIFVRIPKTYRGDDYQTKFDLLVAMFAYVVGARLEYYLEERLDAALGGCSWNCLLFYNDPHYRVEVTDLSNEGGKEITVEELYVLVHERSIEL